MRLALGIEYDGSTYRGWQSQPFGNTVQDYLQPAIEKLAQHAVKLSVAGRTDAGVHAMCQVVSFDTDTVRPINAWVRGVNAHLPRSIRVLWAKEMPEGFNARYQAQERSYQYLLLNAPVAPAVHYGKVGWFFIPLDVERMQEGAQYLLGEHDFSSFRAAECQAKSPIKHMKTASVQARGAMISFKFTASAFLHHQVRNMVGALIYVGKGSLPPMHIKHLLEIRDRRKSPPTFAPDGLYLMGVKYGEEWQLPESESRINDNLWV